MVNRKNALIFLFIKWINKIRYKYVTVKTTFN